MQTRMIRDLLFLFLFVFLACGTPGLKVPPTTELARMASDDTLMAELILRNFYFEPSRIETEVGKPLKLTLKKRSGFLGIIPHDFNLIAPDADLNVVEQKVPGGKGVTITIIPTKVGEYKFFCGKDGHEKKGMVGFLIVKEQLK
ncbi:MAG: cupredoxin domain-containing protein [bacterium]